MKVIGSTDRFGSIIREERLTHNLTLSSLARGLCSAPTLSRIEAGERDPGFLLASGLCERLGMSPGLFEMVIADDEYERLGERRVIDEMIARLDGETEGRIDEYETRHGWRDALERQFVMHRRALFRILGLETEHILMGLSLGGDTATDREKSELSGIAEDFLAARRLTFDGKVKLSLPVGLTAAERSLEVEKESVAFILAGDERERMQSFLRLREAFAGFEAMRYRDSALSRPLYLSALACAAWYCERGEFPQAVAICGRTLELMDGSRDARGKAFVCHAKARAMRLESGGEEYAPQIGELIRLSYHLFGFVGDDRAQKMVMMP